MKSALERAMERFADEPVKELSAGQKERLAEIDRTFDAKVAEAKIRTEPKLAALAGEEADQLRAELAVEIAGFNEARERRKEEVRRESE
jgi:hypothetical protein